MAANRFQAQQLMDDFYSYQPGKDDIAGQMQKNAYQGNFVQSALDTQMAMQLGQYNQGLAQGNMTHQADLEQRNQSALMKEEFQMGMESMDAQFQYQNTAANAQHDRDLGMTAAQGEQQRKNITAQGNDNRLSTIAAGEQERLTADLNNRSQEQIAEGR